MHICINKDILIFGVTWNFKHDIKQQFLNNPPQSSSSCLSVNCQSRDLYQGLLKRFTMSVFASLKMLDFEFHSHLCEFELNLVHTKQHLILGYECILGLRQNPSCNYKEQTSSDVEG